MSSTPSRAGTAYEPLVPSPLNPRSCEDEGLALRRRRNGGGGSSSSKAARRSTTTPGMSPAERLLRHKAAQSWRMQVERREALRARQIKAAAPRPELYPREVVDDTSATVGGPRDEREPSEVKRPGVPDEGGRRLPHYDYLFRMPEVGFFTPQRVVLAMGTKRMMPLVSPHDVLRSARARREREEGRGRAELRMS